MKKSIETVNSQINQINVNEGNVIIQHSAPGYFNNGGFFTAFSEAFYEIATTPMPNLDRALLLLILSYMGKKEYMPTSNIQMLLSQKDYADDLKAKQQNIASSFKRLEEKGYIKRDKRKKQMHILINPDMAYNGKTKDFNKTWNELRIPFGLEEKKYNKTIQEKTEKQDWNSHLLDDLEQVS